ncbi:MAG: hypothetical protein ABII25_00590 [bacterium]
MELITQRFKLGDVLENNDLSIVKDKYRIDGDAEYIRKGLTPSDLKFIDGERCSIEYITTNSPDRDREIVLPQGADLTHYQKNPVVLWLHGKANDKPLLPVGKNLWIKSNENGLVAKTQYAKHAFANDLYNYMKDGFPLANSIGFLPTSVIQKSSFGSTDFQSLGLSKKTIEETERIYDRWLMLEYSKVPVPSNQDAINIAISKGLISESERAKYFIIPDNPLAKEAEVFVENIEKGVEIIKPADSGWDETDSNYRYRIKNPDEFENGSFRTIALKKDKPKIMAVIDKLKGETSTTIQTVIFPKKENWTMATAKKWIEQNPDIVKSLEINDDVLVRDDSNYSANPEKIDKVGRILSGSNLEKIKKAKITLIESVVVLDEMIKIAEDSTIKPVKEIEQSNEFSLDELAKALNIPEKKEITLEELKGFRVQKNKDKGLDLETIKTLFIENNKNLLTEVVSIIKESEERTNNSLMQATGRVTY